MKKQIIIFLLSLWGGIAFAIGYLRELAEDNNIPLCEGLKTTLDAIIVFTDLIWFLPGLLCAKLLGVSNRLYECEIVVMPKHALGWILPIVLWFLIFNFCVFLIGKLKRNRGANKTPKSDE